MHFILTLHLTWSIIYFIQQVTREEMMELQIFIGQSNPCFGPDQTWSSWYPLNPLDFDSHIYGHTFPPNAVINWTQIMNKKF